MNHLPVQVLCTDLLRCIASTRQKENYCDRTLEKTSEYLHWEYILNKSSFFHCWVTGEWNVGRYCVSPITIADPSLCKAEEVNIPNIELGCHVIVVHQSPQTQAELFHGGRRSSLIIKRSGLLNPRIFYEDHIMKTARRDVRWPSPCGGRFSESPLRAMKSTMLPCVTKTDPYFWTVTERRFLWNIADLDYGLTQIE